MITEECMGWPGERVLERERRIYGSLRKVLADLCDREVNWSCNSQTIKDVATLSSLLREYQSPLATRFPRTFGRNGNYWSPLANITRRVAFLRFRAEGLSNDIRLGNSSPRSPSLFSALPALWKGSSFVPWVAIKLFVTWRAPSRFLSTRKLWKEIFFTSTCRTAQNLRYTCLGRIAVNHVAD